MSPGTRIISNRDQFLQLREFWTGLRAKDPKASLFVSFEWIECWMRTYWEDDYSLTVIVLEDAAAAAIVPLYYNPGRGAWYCLGTGEPDACEVASEYVDFLVSGNGEERLRLYEGIAACLQSLKPGRLVVVNCLHDSHVYRVAKLAGRACLLPSGRQYSLVLDGGYDDVEKRFSRNLREKCRRCLNRYHKSDRLRFEIIAGKEFEECWRTLRELHQADWSSRGEPGAFASEKFSEFHRCIHGRHSGDIQLFSVLRDAGEVIGVNFYYVDGETVYFYQSGLMKDGYGSLSPGIMLHALSIAALSGRYRYYDFMKGEVADSYKSRFCTSTGDFFYTVRIYGRNPSGLLGWYWEGIKAALRPFKRLLRGGLGTF